MPSRVSSRSNRLRQFVFTRGLALLLIVLVAGIMALPALSASSPVSLTLGASATQDVLAPRAIRYVSEVLTQAARVQAASAVPDVFDPPDARVARQQVLLLRDILDFMNSVRDDTFAGWGQKLADLTTIRDLPLSPDVAGLIANFTVTQWSAVQSEALSVLEQTMRGQVRPDQLESLRQSIPARVSVDLNEAQVQAVSALVMPLIVSNSFYNEIATQAERDAARAAVAPVSRQFVRGQTVVARGQVIREVDVEALEAFGLMQPELRWQETVSSSLIALVLCILLLVYVQRAAPSLNLSPKSALLLGLLFSFYLLAAKFMVPGHTLLPYLLPAAALAMIVTLLASVNFAIVVSVALAVLVGYIGNNQLELTIYLAAGGIISALILGRAQRFALFFSAGLAVGVANAVIVAAFWMVSPEMDLVGLAQLLAASIGNGVLSASLALLGAFVLGTVFDITTSLQLIELSRPDHPLLQFVLREAPGTYQHCLQVSNLAEQAGERVGANTLLIRVGALYHDVGKALRPQYFIENQLPNAPNIHSTLDPYTSAGIILGHVNDGLELARRYHLPSRIRAFISEHHGTLRTMYQYTRALEAAGNDPARVDQDRFCYPGPRPQSKETALLMLADGAEAKTRADRPANEADLDRIVKAVIDDRLAKNQLDDTDLTVRDLQAIRDSFVTTLKGMFHSRLQYPEEKPAEPQPAPVQPLPAPEPPPQISPDMPVRG